MRIYYTNAIPESILEEIDSKKYLKKEKLFAITH